MNVRRLSLLVALLVLSSLVVHGTPIGSAFDFRGKLYVYGAPANGSYDFQCSLWDSIDGGNLVGPTLTNTAVAVTNGLFTLRLDFGTNVFSGESRYVQIYVQTNTATQFTAMLPRHPVPLAPYALYATKAGSVNIDPWSITTGSVTDGESQVHSNLLMFATGSTWQIIFTPDGGIHGANYDIATWGADFGGDVNVEGRIQAKGDVGINGGGERIAYLGTNGDIGGKGSLNVDSNASVGVDLSVGRNANVQGDLNVASNLHVSGAIDLSFTNLYVDGQTSLHGTTSISDSFNVNNSMSVDGTLNANGGVLASSATVTGNLGVNGGITAHDLSVANCIQGSLCAPSDRNLKNHFQSVDGRDVLARLVGIPVQTWSYNKEDASIRHIGPTAQDFAGAFGVGYDDKRISTVDADGVALAAIQGLNEILTEKDAQIRALEKEVAELRAAVNELLRKSNGVSP